MATINLGKVGMTPRGDWSSTVADYEYLDTIGYLGSGYMVSLKVGKVPAGTLPTNTAYFKKLVDKGDPFVYEDFTPDQLAEIKQPALDAAVVANTAALNADSKATEANTAAINATEKATLANTAATNANIATAAANTATQSANTAATNANDAAGLALAQRSYVNFLFGITQNETDAVIEYARVNGYKKPGNQYITKLDNHIRDLKTHGLFTTMDGAYWFVGDGDLNFKCINIANPELSGTPIGGLTSNLTGIEGNGVDGWINTNINIASQAVHWKLRDAGAAFYVTKEPTPNRTAVFGNDNINFLNRISVTDTNTHRINLIGTTATNINLTGLGFKSLSRIGSKLIGVNQVDTQESELSSGTPVLANANFSVLLNTGGYGNAEISAISMGSALTYEQTQLYRQAILNNL